jgi:hypothetical protein
MSSPRSIVGFAAPSVVAAHVVHVLATTEAEHVIVARDHLRRVHVSGRLDGSYAARLPDRIGVYTRDVTLGQILDDMSAAGGEEILDDLPAASRKKPC